jgi:hypothetical protein
MQVAGFHLLFETAEQRETTNKQQQTSRLRPFRDFCGEANPRSNRPREPGRFFACGQFDFCGKLITKIKQLTLKNF